MRLGRAKVDSGAVMSALVAGRRQRAIAQALGVSYSTLRRQLSRYVRGRGYATPEEAVAAFVAAEIRANLPLALQGRVGWVLRGIRMRVRSEEAETP